jgi:ribosomal protein S18 acetylase RimI-like enzyme
MIRPCSELDLPKLEWFGKYTAHRHLIAQAYTRQQMGEVLMLVADLNGFPVGQLWVDFVRQAQVSIVVLWALRVLAPLQNLGIGSRLIAVAETVARQHGFEQTELGVEKSNPDALRLYERLGYRVIGENEERWTYPTPEGNRVEEVSVEWILRKTLTP